MIKKFKQYIDEGFWKDGINRAKTNSSRQENKLSNTNLYDLKGVDWGGNFLIANQILKVENDRAIFSYEDLEELEPYLKETGWRLMTKREAIFFVENTKWKYIETKDEEPFTNAFFFESLRNGNYIRCSVKSQRGDLYHYLVKPSDVPDFTECIKLNKDNVGNKLQLSHFISPNAFAYVILVKDKNVNEGFWKDGIKRSKTNLIRKEDKLTDTNLYDLKEVDLGLSFNFADRMFCSDAKILFDKKDFEVIKKPIMSEGWRLPTKKDIDELISHKSSIHNGELKMIEPQDDKIGQHMNGGYSVFTTTSEETNQTLGMMCSSHFESFFMLDDKLYTWVVSTKQHKDSPCGSHFWEDETFNTGLLVVLVKDKKDKPINEKFWKGSIERIKTNTKRLGDIIRPKSHEELRELVEQFVDEQGPDANLNEIDTSLIDDMSYLFEDIDIRNPQMNKWNTSNVTNMEHMFFGCRHFNSDISDWDVSNVEDMSMMFFDCRNFNQPIGKWKAKPKLLISTFCDCAKFNQDLSGWDTSNVVDMVCLFTNCVNFNGDISTWNTSNVSDMEQIFSKCRKFNQDISKWDVGQVVTFSGAFSGCVSFNQDIGGWDTRNVVYGDHMFLDCTLFNQDISNWDMRKCSSGANMFKDCASFDCDLSKWDVEPVLIYNMRNMFEGCPSNNKYKIVKNWRQKLIDAGKLNIIKEGFWKPAINRAKTGELRIGESTPFERYVKSIKWIDLGNKDYLFAQDDFCTESDKLFTIKEIKNLNLPDGVSIVDMNRFDYIIYYNCKLEFEKKDGMDIIKATSKHTGEVVNLISRTKDSHTAVPYVDDVMYEERWERYIFHSERPYTTRPDYRSHTEYIERYEKNKMDSERFAIKLMKKK